MKFAVRVMVAAALMLGVAYSTQSSQISSSSTPLVSNSATISGNPIPDCPPSGCAGH